MKHLVIFVGLLATLHASCQDSCLFNRLPVGKYMVGFKIFTITDSSRVDIPEYNYLGEKNKGDRHKKITVHMWYPALENKKSRSLTYRDYCFNQLLKNTNDAIPVADREAEANDRRAAVERWFGKTSDEAWSSLLHKPMLAHAAAVPLKGNFPLLIGVLRPLSTSVINEVLASNGYIVAMITERNSSSFAESALTTVPGMQFVISFLGRTAGINTDNVGAFGFSGSGFTQVYLAMNDYRIKALADIESGIYMDGLYQEFSKSNYYAPAKLHAPFLHIFSRDLSKQEKFIDDFETKTKFSKRYRLLLNQPALHHWDFACEGYTAALFLGNRGEQSENIRLSYEIAAMYILNFFNAVLKHDASAENMLRSKPSLPSAPSTMWDVSVIHAIKQAPGPDDFEYIMKAKGVDAAVSIAKAAIKDDTLTDLWLWYKINGLGYKYLGLKKYKEAIALFKLNTELHPGDANLFDSLAEGYEASGDKENMKSISQTIIGMLALKNTLSDAEKGIKENAERRLK